MNTAAAPAVFDRLAALSDATRARLLACLERHELTVGELQDVLQLPQSTVSRHLKALADAGWVISREAGPSNRYRMAGRELDAAARRLWQAVREEVAHHPAAQRDLARVHEVIARRHTKSQEFFATASGQWDRLRSELFGARPELFALLGLLDPAWTIADLGCGTGQMAEAVAPFVRRVIAVDEATAMLRAARTRLHGVENAELRHGPLEALPLDAHSVDVAIVSLVLPYVADPVQALGEVHRIVRPGGRAVVVDMLPHEHEEYRQTMGHLWLGFDAVRITHWAHEAGFSAVRVRALPAQPGAKGPSLFTAILSNAPQRRRGKKH
ncbi:MAG: metalloregulator ArsR/SmtB family transcription factor [Gemmatimonadaceae bacterium]|nr:metalloregulator ArsR/SmtB family transcription factor [Gemmatimonadaceae bacterium]